MSFQEFTAKNVKSGGEPRVTISKQGIISLNKSCYRRFIKPKGEFVVLMYDADKKKIGIKPVGKDVAHAYKMRNAAGQPQISGTAFLNHHDIRPNKTTRYKAEWDEKSQAVVISL